MHDSRLWHCIFFRIFSWIFMGCAQRGTMSFKMHDLCGGQVGPLDLLIWDNLLSQSDPDADLQTWVEVLPDDSTSFWCADGMTHQTFLVLVWPLKLHLSLNAIKGIPGVSMYPRYPVLFCFGPCFVGSVLWGLPSSPLEDVAMADLRSTYKSTPHAVHTCCLSASALGWWCDQKLEIRCECHGCAWTTSEDQRLITPNDARWDSKDYYFDARIIRCVTLNVSPFNQNWSAAAYADSWLRAVRIETFAKLRSFPEFRDGNFTGGVPQEDAVQSTWNYQGLKSASRPVCKSILTIYLSRASCTQIGA